MSWPWITSTNKKRKYTDRSDDRILNLASLKIHSTPTFVKACVSCLCFCSFPVASKENRRCGTQLGVRSNSWSVWQNDITSKETSNPWFDNMKHCGYHRTQFVRPVGRPIAILNNLLTVRDLGEGWSNSWELGSSGWENLLCINFFVTEREFQGIFWILYDRKWLWCNSIYLIFKFWTLRVGAHSRLCAHWILTTLRE